GWVLFSFNSLPEQPAQELYALSYAPRPLGRKIEPERILSHFGRNVEMLARNERNLQFLRGPLEQRQHFKPLGQLTPDEQTALGAGIGARLWEKLVHCG